MPTLTAPAPAAPPVTRAALYAERDRIERRAYHDLQRLTEIRALLADMPADEHHIRDI
jgi:hypothetical protein